MKSRICSLPKKLYGFQILQKSLDFFGIFGSFWIVSDFFGFFRIFRIFSDFSDIIGVYEDFFGWTNPRENWWKCLGLDEMSNEEWIVFRNKIVKLDDYLETWMQTVNEADESCAVITWLRNQIGTYKVCSSFPFQWSTN